MQALINTEASAQWMPDGRTTNRFNGLWPLQKAVETARRSRALPCHRAEATVLMRDAFRPVAIPAMGISAIHPLPSAFKCA